ncbi:ABC transporter [Hysterangium stoloniferum]|nr:ABC transporter [Hysterangium stoloniferum]
MDSVAPPSGDETFVLTGRRLAVVYSSFLLASFLPNLDQTIVATALPQIASRFNALNQATWVANAFFLTLAGFTLAVGQILTVVPLRSVFLSSILLFEIGSALSGFAQSIDVLILGRAIAGAGGTGITVSAIVAVVKLAHPEIRPILYGSYGGMYAVASVSGPLLGKPDRLSWRWCFLINLPAALAGIAVALTLRGTQNPPQSRASTTFKNRLYCYVRALDWIGSILCLGFVTTLLLALQWGGIVKAWSDPVIITCFVLSGVLCVLFVLWQKKLGLNAMLPLSIFLRRTQLGACLHSVRSWDKFHLATFVTDFFPYFRHQAKGQPATMAGISILPLMLSFVFGKSSLQVPSLQWTGHYWHWLLWPPAIAAVGSGMLTTIDRDLPGGRVVLYQILCGVSLLKTSGKTEWLDKPEMVMQATSIVTFLQFMGGIVALSVAGTIFTNRLKTNLQLFVPGLPSSLAEELRLSVTLVKDLSPDIRDPVITAYIRSIRPIFWLGVAASVLCIGFTL